MVTASTVYAAQCAAEILPLPTSVTQVDALVGRLNSDRWSEAYAIARGLGVLKWFIPGSTWVKPGGDPVTRVKIAETIEKPVECPTTQPYIDLLNEVWVVTDSTGKSRVSAVLGVLPRK